MTDTPQPDHSQQQIVQRWKKHEKELRAEAAKCEPLTQARLTGQAEGIALCAYDLTASLADVQPSAQYSRLQQIVDEMRSIAIVAGQCSVEAPNSGNASMAAAEAVRCSLWADQIAALLTEGVQPSARQEAAEEHDPLCSEGKIYGGQTAPCDCHLSRASSPVAPAAGEADIEQAFRAGFHDGLLSVDKFGEQIDTADECWTDYQRKLRAASPETETPQ